MAHVRYIEYAGMTSRLSHKIGNSPRFLCLIIPERSESLEVMIGFKIYGVGKPPVSGHSQDQKKWPLKRGVPLRDEGIYSLRSWPQARR